MRNGCGGCPNPLMALQALLARAWFSQTNVLHAEHFSPPDEPGRLAGTIQAALANLNAQLADLERGAVGDNSTFAQQREKILDVKSAEFMMDLFKNHRSAHMLYSENVQVRNWLDTKVDKARYDEKYGSRFSSEGLTVNSGQLAIKDLLAKHSKLLKAIEENGPNEGLFIRSPQEFEVLKEFREHDTKLKALQAKIAGMISRQDGTRSAVPKAIATLNNLILAVQFFALISPYLDDNSLYKILAMTALSASTWGVTFGTRIVHDRYVMGAANMRTVYVYGENMAQDAVSTSVILKHRKVATLKTTYKPTSAMCAVFYVATQSLNMAFEKTNTTVNDYNYEDISRFTVFTIGSLLYILNRARKFENTLVYREDYISRLCSEYSKMFESLTSISHNPMIIFRCNIPGRHRAFDKSVTIAEFLLLALIQMQTMEVAFEDSRGGMERDVSEQLQNFMQRLKTFTMARLGNTKFINCENFRCIDVPRSRDGSYNSPSYTAVMSAVSDAVSKRPGANKYISKAVFGAGRGSIVWVLAAALENEVLSGWTKMGAAAGLGVLTTAFEVLRVRVDNVTATRAVFFNAASTASIDLGALGYARYLGETANEITVQVTPGFKVLQQLVARTTLEICRKRAQLPANVISEIASRLSDLSDQSRQEMIKDLSISDDERDAILSKLTPNSSGKQLTPSEKDALFHTINPLIKANKQANGSFRSLGDGDKSLVSSVIFTAYAKVLTENEIPPEKLAHLSETQIMRIADSVSNVACDFVSSSLTHNIFNLGLLSCFAVDYQQVNLHTTPNKDDKDDRFNEGLVENNIRKVLEMLFAENGISFDSTITKHVTTTTGAPGADEHDPDAELGGGGASAGDTAIEVGDGGAAANDNGAGPAAGHAEKIRRSGARRTASSRRRGGRQ